MRKLFVRGKDLVPPAMKSRKSASDFSFAGSVISRAAAMAILAFVFCLDSRAALTKLWEHRYDGTTNRSALGILPVIDPDGSVIVTGYADGRRYTGRYGVDGHLIWEKTHEEVPISVVVDPLGNIVISAFVEGRTNGVFTYKTLVGKYARETGAVLWEERDYLPGVRRWRAALNSAGDVILTGDDRSGPTGKIYVAKLRGADGQEHWRTEHGTNSDDSSSAIAVDRTGDVFVGGTSEGLFFLAKFSGSDGRLLWSQTHENPREPQPGWTSGVFLLSLDKIGDVVAAGKVDKDVLTAKYRGIDGQLLWERIYDPSPEGMELNRLITDAADDVFVAVIEKKFRGAEMHEPGMVHLTKYDAETGETKWEQKRQGVPIRSNEVVGMKTDSEGNLVTALLSSSYYGLNEPILHIREFAANDGALNWEIVQENLWHGSWVGFAMDPEGRIALTGKNNDDLTTILYQDEVSPKLDAASAASGVLKIKWPLSHLGSQLEMQSGNGISVADGWTIVGGSTNTNQVTVPIDLESKTRFFRLIPKN